MFLTVHIIIVQMLIILNISVSRNLNNSLARNPPRCFIFD